MAAVSGTTIRAFMPGDEPRLVALWNAAYAGYAGYVRRTVEYWRWCILDRPGLLPADVLVLDDAARQTIGYGVLGPTDSVLELALDPAVTGAAREAAAARLMSALEDRCRARGGEAISFMLPHADDAMQRGLTRAGYRAERVPALTSTIVDVAALFELLLRHRASRIPPALPPSFRVRVERGAARTPAVLVTRIELAPQLAVVREAPDAPAPAADCTVATDLATLNRVVFRIETFDAAVTAGRLTVQPPTSEGAARTLLGLVTLAAPWFTPAADAR
jgi:GNAT superfamily N-acetyltransferase